MRTKARFKLVGQCSEAERRAAIESLIVDIIAASPLPIQEQRKLAQIMSRWRDMGDAAPLAMVTQILVEEAAASLGISIPATPEAAVLEVNFDGNSTAQNSL